MSNCIGCKFYDDSVDCCNADEHCYQEGYQQGREDEREKIEQILSELPTVNGYIDSAWMWNKFDQLKGNKNE